MKRLILTAAAISVLAVGCQSKKQDETGSVERRQLLNLETDSSHSLTEVAELILSPNNYKISHKLFTEALKKDPKNFKAQFYLTMFERLEILRGIETRIDGFAKSVGFDQELEQLQRRGQLLSEILTGDKDSDRDQIKSTKDLQTLFIQYRNASVKFYELLKSNSENALLISVPLAVQSADDSDSCRVDAKGQSEYLVVCKTNLTQSVVLQAPDLVAMRLFAIIDALYLSFPLAYDWSGLEGKIKKNEKLSLDEFRSRAKGTEFGRILNPEVLKIYRLVGTDALQALKWWRANSERYCSTRTDEKGELHIDGPFVCHDDRKGLDGTIAILEKMVSDKLYFKESISHNPLAYNLVQNEEGPLNDKNLMSFSFKEAQKERNYVLVDTREEASIAIQPLSLVETPVDNIVELFMNQPDRVCSDSLYKRDYVSLKDLAETMCTIAYENN